MTATVQRAFAILDALAGRPDGVSLGAIANTVDIPKSAAHRLLAELGELGYVRQLDSGGYALGLPAISLGLRHLRELPLVDAAGPALARLAEASGELARLSVFDGQLLMWVAKRQGSQSGLRFDPDSGAEAELTTTATGIAWLSTLPDAEIGERIADQHQRLGRDGDAPPVPTELIERARRDGYCYADGTYEIGLAGVAVPIALPGSAAAGVFSVAGPSVRFGLAQARAVAPLMIALAAELAPVTAHAREEHTSRWA